MSGGWQDHRPAGSKEHIADVHCEFAAMVAEDPIVAAVFGAAMARGLDEITTLRWMVVELARSRGEILAKYDEEVRNNRGSLKCYEV